MTRTTALLALLIGIGVSGLWLVKSSRAPEGVQNAPALSGPSVPASSKPRSVPPSSALPRRRRDLILSSARVVPRPPHSKPEDNVIPFRVVKGVALAYGDQLLGTPQQKGMTTGYYEAPRPQLWDQPTLPFVISKDLFDPDRVKRAFEIFRRAGTAITFVPWEGQPDGLSFEPWEKDCVSALGHQGGLQPIKLSPKCGPGEIAHEIMHALGFVHEQSRADRDAYIQVLWDNIEPKFQSQYEMVPDSFMVVSRGAAFDYHSIMLYGTDAFAANPGLQTMRSKTDEPISPAKDALSEGDIERLNRLYPP